MDKTMLKFRIEGYKRKAKETFDKTVSTVKNFYVEHPAEAASITIAFLGLARQELKSFDMQKAIKMERHKQNRTIYDHSMNYRWVTKRDMTSEERGEISYRHNTLGQDYYTILTSMNLL